MSKICFGLLAGYGLNFVNKFVYEFGQT